jgi:hypothetical protein
MRRDLVPGLFLVCLDDFNLKQTTAPRALSAWLAPFPSPPKQDMNDDSVPQSFVDLRAQPGGTHSAQSNEQPVWVVLPNMMMTL